MAVYARVLQAASVDRTVVMATATVTGGHSHLGSRAVAKMALGFDPPYPPWGMVPFVCRRLKQVSASSGLLPSVHATVAILTWSFSVGRWSLGEA